MAYLNKEAYEGKREYAARRMAENAEIETLTKEQHEAIERLCTIRHEIHSTDARDMFNSESCEHRDLYTYLEELTGFTSSGINLMESVGLPKLDFGDWTTWPDDRDYYEFLSDDERQEYEDKAESYMQECTEEGNKPAFYVDGYQMWLEEGEEFQFFSDQLAAMNNTIESYLMRIDKEHGTNYCPTGATRIF